MNANINCTLKGEYKVDIFSGKNLVETIDWFSNDITNWGMTYPFDYSFAQCFMFLSLGSGIYGDINNNPYTGLKSPIKNFKVYNPNSGIHNQSGEYIGWQGYEIGAKHQLPYRRTSTSCGSKITKNGINLYRGWSIPTGNAENDTVIAEPNGLLIKQLMVSPSSGSNIKGNKAFSLVDRDILIPSGYSAVISYQLSINFKDYENIQFFSGTKNQGTNGYFDTGNAETGKDGSEIELLKSWANLSGIYRLIFPAIQLVDDIGACVSPKVGYDLEPFVINNTKTRFYLSPDISHFMVNSSGGIPSSEYEAYNATGLMGNYSELSKNLVIYSKDIQGDPFGSDAQKWFYSGDSLINSDTNEDYLLNNIRLYNIPSISNYNSGALSQNDFSYQTLDYIGAKNYPLAFATPGKLGFNYSYSDFGQKAVFSSYLKRYPINPVLYQTGVGQFQRSKYVTKKALFPSLYSYGYNSRYGSLVLAHDRASNTDIEESIFRPYLDFLFFDSEGRASNMAHYRYIPYIYLEDRGSGVAKAKFDILEEATGFSFPQVSSVNDYLFSDSLLGYFNNLNNGNSKIALYGYKNKGDEKLISAPKFFTGFNNANPQGFPYNMYFAWNENQNFDGYYVLIHDLPQLGIQSLNMKSGIIISDLSASVFTIGKTNAVNYVEGIGYLQDFANIYEQYLANPKITGEKPESINRFFSATGFMGNGISTSFNSSGINTQHPMLLNSALINDPGSFIPPGNKVSGFLLPGKILNENIKGNINYNNNIGYGSVYGIIANSGFYSKDYDLCLLDKPNWNEFGDPNPTGHQSKLCWPSYKKKIRLEISAGYFLSGSGIIDDPTDYFANGQRQIINDITMIGSNNHHNKSFFIPSVYNDFCFSGLGDSDITLFKDINQDFKFKITGENSTFDINIILKSGLASINPRKTGVFFSGFPNNFSLAERGSGANFNFNSVIYPIKIISGNDTKEYQLITTGNPPNTGNLYIAPTNFKKPIGRIYHLESGYRILPNYAIANTGKINTYLPVTGGTYPGLSTENAMEIYLTLNWSSE